MQIRFNSYYALIDPLLDAWTSLERAVLGSGSWPLLAPPRLGRPTSLSLRGPMPARPQATSRRLLGFAIAYFFTLQLS